MKNLMKNALIGEVNAPVANASNTDDNSDILDMSGYEGVLFVVPITDSAQNGVASLVVEQNSANSDSGMTAVTGGTATATCAVADDLNDKLLIVDVYRPTERYVQAVLKSATANIAFGSTIAVRYGARKTPVTADGTVLDAEVLASPA